MRSYTLSAIVEPDDAVWRAYIPELEARGAASWGAPREEGLKNLQEVVQMVVEDLLADGEPLPESARVSEQPAVAVNVG